MTYKDSQGHIYNGGAMTRLVDGVLFTGIPTVEQLTAWGYEEVLPPEPYVPTAEDLKRERMGQIQSLLQETDYIIIKKVEGYDISSYDAQYDGDFMGWRESLRDEYNQLESEISD